MLFPITWLFKWIDNIFDEKLVRWLVYKGDVSASYSTWMPVWLDKNKHLSWDLLYLTALSSVFSSHSQGPLNWENQLICLRAEQPFSGTDRGQWIRHERNSVKFKRDKHKVLPQRVQSLWIDMRWGWRGWGAALWESPQSGGGQRAEYEHEFSTMSEWLCRASPQYITTKSLPLIVPISLIWGFEN